MATPSLFIAPDDIFRANWRTDYERGGVDLQDPSQGFEVRDWYTLTDDTGLYLHPADNPLALTPIVLLPGITYSSASFDTNMRPIVAYTIAGASYLRWFDPVPNSIVDLALPVGTRTPALSLDDKRPGAEDVRDTLLFYLRGSSLYYRQLRDRFTVERELRVLSGDNWSIRRVGMNNLFRIQIELWRN